MTERNIFNDIIQKKTIIDGPDWQIHNDLDSEIRVEVTVFEANGWKDKFGRRRLLSICIRKEVRCNG